MESGTGTEILKVTAAIVSAFQTAADTLEIIKDRKEKKKRKKDKDVEELLEIKILHKSLVEGGTRCRKHCENRHQQFRPAFEAGDDIATLALKDVVISLQTEVLQALHIARAVENARLDFTTLYEASVTNCKDATRAMDQLCQRITASMQFQPQHGGSTFGARTMPSPSNSSIRSSFASMHLPDRNESYDMPPTPPASINPREPIYQRGLPQRTLTIRRASDRVPVGGKGRQDEPQPTSQAAPLGWISSQVKPNSSHLTIGNLPSSTAGEEQQSHHVSDDRDLERRSQSSIQNSATESDRGSVHLHPTSAISMPISRYSPRPSTSDRPPTPPEKPPYQRTAPPQRMVILKAEPTSLCHATIETAEDLLRASEAPEVVSADFEGIYSMPTRPEEMEKYPAFLTQADFTERLLSLPAGMENIWMPLKRPAMHNRYHGFCKGAWQIRKAVHEGLQVQLTQPAKEPVLHWACKECNFKSRAPNADALPTHILFNQKYNVRFRWLFLAKSHRSAESSSDMLENYKYGCIFCAAQGQTTAAHDKLDHLMLHIISKHKSTSLTPEVREKTKCVIGSVVNQGDDWDINVPESNQKGAGVVADELLISASRFFSRRKGRR